jgi:hypothetical protein
MAHAGHRNHPCRFRAQSVPIGAAATGEQPEAEPRADDDWASWYAQWLIDLSELPDLPGARPARSELVYLLVSLDEQYTAEAPGEPWETCYARQILRHFRPSGS